MAYETGTATDYKDLLTKLMTFLSSGVTCSAVTPGSNTGDGSVSTGPTAADDAPAETWTLTATSATNFTVSGSVSGSQAAAIVGTAYDNGIVAFTVTAGTTAFVSGDSFSFTTSVVLGEQKWTVNEWTTSDNYELLLQGPGTSGNDEIFTAIRTREYNTWHNWILNGYTGYSSELDFYTQAGSIHSTNHYFMPFVPLWDSSIKYWFVGNGRRYIVVAKVASVYVSLYQGFLLPYSLPTQFPYPLIVAGSGYRTDNSDTYRKYTSTSYSLRCFPDCHANDDYGAGFYLDSQWRAFGNYNTETQYPNSSSCARVWPMWMGNATQYANTAQSNQFLWKSRKNFDGSVHLLPCCLWTEHPDPNWLGEFQGVYWVTGDGMTSEDTVTIGGKTHVVFQNVWRTGAWNYWALLLE